MSSTVIWSLFFFQAEDGIRDRDVTGVQTCALPISTVGRSPAVVMLGGLVVFGVVFAINSTVHSYLILAYSDGDQVAMNVGFYYMANAGGRLAGTVLSGLVYQLYGLAGCLWACV